MNNNFGDGLNEILSLLLAGVNLQKDTASCNENPPENPKRSYLKVCSPVVGGLMGMHNSCPKIVPVSDCVFEEGL